MIEAVDGEETVLYVNDVQTFVTPPIMEFVLSGANDDDVQDDIVVRQEPIKERSIDLTDSDVVNKAPANAQVSEIFAQALANTRDGDRYSPMTGSNYANSYNTYGPPGLVKPEHQIMQNDMADFDFDVKIRVGQDDVTYLQRD